MEEEEGNVEERMRSRRAAFGEEDEENVEKRIRSSQWKSRSNRNLFLTKSYHPGWQGWGNNL